MQGPSPAGGGYKRERRDARPAVGFGSRRCGGAPAPSGRGGSAAVSAGGGRGGETQAPQQGFAGGRGWAALHPDLRAGRVPSVAPRHPEPSAVVWLGREVGARDPPPRRRSHPELQGGGILAGDVPHAAGTRTRSRWSLEPHPAAGEGWTPRPGCVLRSRGAGWRPPARLGGRWWVLPRQLSSAGREEGGWGWAGGTRTHTCFWGAATRRCHRTSIPDTGQHCEDPPERGPQLGGGGGWAVTPHGSRESGLGSRCGAAWGAGGVTPGRASPWGPPRPMPPSPRRWSLGDGGELRGAHLRQRLPPAAGEPPPAPGGDERLGSPPTATPLPTQPPGERAAPQVGVGGFRGGNGQQRALPFHPAGLREQLLPRRHPTGEETPRRGTGYPQAPPQPFGQQEAGAGSAAEQEAAGGAGALPATAGSPQRQRGRAAGAAGKGPPGTRGTRRRGPRGSGGCPEGEGATTRGGGSATRS